VVAGHALGRHSLWLGRQMETTRAFGVMCAASMSAVLLLHSTAGTRTTHTGMDIAAAEGHISSTSTPTAHANSIHSTNRDMVVLNAEDASGPEDQPAAASLHPATETYILGKRETLSSLLRRAGITPQNAHTAVTALSAVADMRRLRAGTAFQLRRQPDQHDHLHALSFRRDFAVVAAVTAKGDGYDAAEHPVRVQEKTEVVQGTIKDSLYLTAKAAGAPDHAIHDLIRLMSFDVDFQRDIWPGDHFELMFTTAKADGYDDIQVRDLRFARLSLRDKPIEAMRFETADGRTRYFDADGSSTQKALMRTPVNGARLSSGFGKRKHPILGYTRLHKGLDFAAPRGTPVMAAGDGVIEMAARNGGYGNYVRIRHGSDYKTAYAHLNGFAKGVAKGRRVSQGDIIGYIGSTGRSTGPHLHYEILRDGRQVNPSRLKLPDAHQLSGAELAAFNAARETAITEMVAALNASTLLATQETGGQKDSASEGR